MVLFSEDCGFISDRGRSFLLSLCTCGLVSVIRVSHMAIGKCPLSPVFFPNITHLKPLYLQGHCYNVCCWWLIG